MENPGLCLTPFQRKYLLKNLETDLRGEYRRRIEIMLLFDAGQTQAQICKTLGCSQETARYWIAIASSKQAHKWSDRPMGRPKTVNEQYLVRLQELASHSPREYGYSFQRWTGQWLSKHLSKELGIKVSRLPHQAIASFVSLSCLCDRNLVACSLFRTPKSLGDCTRMLAIRIFLKPIDLIRF